jgi:hypothetical protein
MYWTGWTKTAQFCRVNERIGHHLHKRILFFDIARFEVQILGEELKTFSKVFSFKQIDEVTTSFPFRL